MKPHAWEDFAEVMFDLRDHAPRALPGGGLVMEAAVADQRRVTGTAAWPGEQVLDLPLRDSIGRRPDRVADPSAFQRLVERGQSESGVRPNHHGLPAPAVPINDGRRTSSHPAALWTLPDRSFAARRSPSGLKTKSG